ncbi:Acyl-coenzyme A oxidase 3 [Wickerhamomyces ciferrii]|uniref:Acyl-coenzyme A oxidase n=1 Tax=Wickerhamomyces ciferrii (strain ATCC 14091 / BCRC 22168 / CBS 111 / JCM 3599 / NBRC 0793 / NRRL Y-1031 F-60-10) TaxID=1206466 RepID=K0KCV5_WICCF|nr:Acyl-coenzyme A oxidase 3 [Wickerhamomyces ciferrii]CCH40726.1 Acyl-coenzyme A oxidase 3 [Wickerhamomyces ciferrii]
MSAQESDRLIQERAIERAGTSFNVQDLIHYLDDGEENTKIYESMSLQLERDPIFKIKSSHLDLKAKRELAFKKIVKLAGYFQNSDEVELRNRIRILSLIDPDVATRIGVHYGLFIGTLRALGSSKQFEFWIKKGAFSLSNFYGCFAMTELAHGSNVAALQTTATYDPQDETFIIHTPSLSATKWWIGGAAHSATHAVVYARLISQGKDYGVKNFIVQLRNSQHELLPGVSVGDIGKKMGRDGIDNGWIQFTNVKIPKFNMLDKYAKVDNDGKVTLPQFQQLGYTALVVGRVSMVVDSYNTGKKFLTIALRYASTRRQFGKDSEGKEKKIIDYTHHRRRLFPLLASVYAMNSAALVISKFQDEANKLVESGENLKHVIPNLKDLFGLSAGLKAFCTWETAHIIDETRQSCGGHGYSDYNAFARGYNDWVVQCTWEGDNNVLSMSCGRALIQNYLSVEKKKIVGKYTKYLETTDISNEFELKSQDLEYIEKIIKAWEFVSKSLIVKSTNKFKNFVKEFNGDVELAFEKISSYRFIIAKVHTKLILLKSFYERILEAPKNLKPVLSLLLQLYSLSITSENISQFYSFNIVKGSDFLENLNYKIDEINELLRPDIIGLTDAFNLSDFVIDSQIGKRNGDIYESYFKHVNDNNSDLKPHYYDSIMKPFFQRDMKPSDNEEVDEEEEE